MTSFRQRLANTKKKAKDGFTMIELMVVVAIIGVLSSVALPALTNAQARAKSSAAKQESVNTAKTCTIALIVVMQLRLQVLMLLLSPLVMLPLLVPLVLSLKPSPLLVVVTLGL